MTIKTGTNGGETINGTSRSELIFGRKGNDTIVGGLGNDIIDGGAGIDTAVFAGDYASYQITDFGTPLNILKVVGADGHDLLTRIEFLRFDDGIFDVATDTFTPDAPPPLPVVSLSPATTSVTEGGAFSFTFTRTGDLSQALTVNYVVNDGLESGGATRGDDFTAPAGLQTVTFAAGSATATITVATVDDAAVEGSEQLFVVLSLGDGYEVSGTANQSLATILDNDVAPPPLPSVSINDVTVTEATTQFGFSGNPYNGGVTSNPNGGFFEINFTVSLSAASAVPVTVNFAAPEGFSMDPSVATPGQDFIRTNGSITFQPGETSRTLRVYGADDFSPEPTQTFAVTLSNPTNATIADAVGVATILDTDVAAPRPTISVGPAAASANEGDSFTFTFTRTGDTSLGFTANYIVNNGAPLGGATNGSDFTAPPGIQQVAFAANSATASITVATIEDAVAEGNESFSVLVSGGLNYDTSMSAGSATATIIDDDVAARPTITLATLAVRGNEGDSFDFAFTRSGDTSQVFTFNYVVNGGTGPGQATAGMDFTAPSGLQQLTFEAGSDTAVLSVQTINDEVAEGEEQFAVVLAGGNYDTVFGFGSANGIINANDGFMA